MEPMARMMTLSFSTFLLVPNVTAVEVSLSVASLLSRDGGTSFASHANNVPVQDVALHMRPALAYMCLSCPLNSSHRLKHRF